MKDDSNRSLRHVGRKAGGTEDRTVVVDSSAFFSDTPPEPPKPPRRPSSNKPSSGSRRTPPPRRSGPADGAARFVDSPCPDHICEGFGWLSNEDQTATCLPARAVLTIVPVS